MEGHGGAVVLRPGTVLFRSMVTTLFYCCRYHRKKAEVSMQSGMYSTWVQQEYLNVTVTDV